MSRKRPYWKIAPKAGSKLFNTDRETGRVYIYDTRKQARVGLALMRKRYPNSKYAINAVVGKMRLLNA